MKSVRDIHFNSNPMMKIKKPLEPLTNNSIILDDDDEEYESVIKQYSSKICAILVMNYIFFKSCRTLSVWETMMWNLLMWGYLRKL
jgi:hypothetical protein